MLSDRDVPRSGRRRRRYGQSIDRRNCRRRCQGCRIQRQRQDEARGFGQWRCSQIGMCHGAEGAGGAMDKASIAGTAADAAKAAVSKGKGKMKPVASVSGDALRSECATERKAPAALWTKHRSPELPPTLPRLPYPKAKAR